MADRKLLASNDVTCKRSISQLPLDYYVGIQYDDSTVIVPAIPQTPLTILTALMPLKQIRRYPLTIPRIPFEDSADTFNDSADTL